jgi:hypothetical protein
LTDQTSQADKDRVSCAVVHRMYRDSNERQPLMDACQVFHIARKSIKRLDNNYVEGALTRGVH